ncbi:MAG: hypothetical protein Q9183_003184 [Haloplaca sp. 2 TL-2023]
MDASHFSYTQRNGIHGADADHSFLGHPGRTRNGVPRHCNEIPNPVATIAETYYLRSRVATLEHLLVECQKEKTTAQNVTEYLLKHLARFATGSECLSARDTCCGQHAAAIPVGQGVEMDIWKAINSVSQRLATLQDSISDQNRAPTSLDTSGDLLGDLDDQENLQQLDSNFCVRGSSTHPNHVAATPLRAASAYSWGRVSYEGGGQPMGPNPAPAGQSCTPEDKDFSRGPYITRFNRPNNEHAPRTSGSSQNCPNVLEPQKGHLTSDESPGAASGSDRSSTTANSRSDEASMGVTCTNTSFSAANETGGSPSQSRKYCQSWNAVFAHSRSSIDVFSAKHRQTSRDSEEPLMEASAESEDESGYAAPSSASAFVPTWHIDPSINASFCTESMVWAHKDAAGNEEFQYPHFFKYGIRFCPHPSETNIYSSELIERLPRNATISNLLSNIRGGAVLDAKLLDTSSINGYFTALIQFVYEHSARSMELQAKRAPFGFSGVPARVILLPTPTWPLSPGTRAAVMVHGHTRCLEVRGLPLSITPAELKRDLRLHKAMGHSHGIEFMQKRPDGVVEVRFTSVDNAGRAYGILTMWRRYKGCNVKRSPDPCTQPWDRISSPSDYVSASSAGLKTKKVEVADKDAVQLRQQRLYDIFKTPPKTRPSSYESTFSVDQTGRLTNAEDDQVAGNQRGRGSSFEAPRQENEKSCAQQ